jgi:hypothetical protein
VHFFSLYTLACKLKVHFHKVGPFGTLVPSAYKILVGRPEGRGHLEDLGIVRKIILKWVLGK